MESTVRRPGKIQKKKSPLLYILVKTGILITTKEQKSVVLFKICASKNMNFKSYACCVTQLTVFPTTSKALENLRVYLCEKIIAERHFDHLRAKKILSREDTEEISCRTSSRKRAGKLLDYLQENPKGLDTLVESIRREKTQNFLIQKITDEVLKLRNIKLEHLKGLKCSSCEPFPDGATNNLSRSNSDESNFSEKLRASTIMYHPEGESSTAPFFSTDSSLNLPVLEVGRTENPTFSSTTLPRPGDPGAPPLPPELQLEEEGNSSEMFLPLRSRAVLRQ